MEAYVQYSINGAYGTIGNLMKPPYTTITAYDLNKPAITWQVGFGDDPSLAADGVTGTGVTQMRNGVVVTADGSKVLVYGHGGDDRFLDAYSPHTGARLWSRHHVTLGCLCLSRCCSCCYSSRITSMHGLELTFE